MKLESFLKWRIIEHKSLKEQNLAKITSGKSKERVTIIVNAYDDGRLLPPFSIFKTSKPGNKTFKDVPAK